MSQTVGEGVVVTLDSLIFPECEKVAKVRDESQSIGNFIEWLGEQGISLSANQEVTDGDYNDERTVTMTLPIRETTEQILAKYFDIDLKKVEAEKQTILDALRDG